MPGSLGGELATSRRSRGQLDPRAAVSRDRLDRGTGPRADGVDRATDARATPEASPGSRRVCETKPVSTKIASPRTISPQGQRPRREEHDRERERARRRARAGASTAGRRRAAARRRSGWTGTGPVSLGGSSCTAVSPDVPRVRAPHCGQKRALGGSSAPQLGHSAFGTDSLLLRSGTWLERPQRFGRLAPQRADELAVVLVRDLAGAVVELELLQRRERAVALLGQLERAAAPARPARRAVVVRAPARAGTAARRRRTQAAASSAPTDEREARSCPCERRELAVPRREAPLLARVRPERDQRAERKTSPASQIRFTSGLTNTLKYDASRPG